jgi:hypothetical protein
MEKYGFVYIWYDHKNIRFYIGSHWGHENDGYICSSRWMRNAYKRRPNDFKRRIISLIYSNRKDLLLEEQIVTLFAIQQKQIHLLNDIRASMNSGNGRHEKKSA